MIKDYSLCKPYLKSTDNRCASCICAGCFNHTPFGDCSLGLSACDDDCLHCSAVGYCNAYSLGTLSERVRSLQ